MRQTRVILIGKRKIIIYDGWKFHVIIGRTRVTYDNGKIIGINAYQGKIPVRKEDVIFKLSGEGLVRISILRSVSTDGDRQK